MSLIENISKDLLRSLRQLEPVSAGNMGVKGFEGNLPPVNPEERSHILNHLKELSNQLQDLLKTDELSYEERVDAEVASANIYVLTSKEEAIEDWRINPSWYISQVNGGLHELVSREWDLPENRICGLKKRLAQVPDFLGWARKNLVVQDVPKEWIDLAQQSVKGHKRLIEGSLKPFVKVSIGDDAEIDELCAASLLAVSEFGSYLNQILPEAQGSFACGRGHFERMLKSVHMVDMDADELKAFGEAKIEEYEAALVEAAKLINPEKHWTELISDFKNDHPTPESLLDSYLNEGRLAEEFVREKDLISIPEGQTWTVVPVPEYSRAMFPLGHMRTSPPFTDDFSSALCITPIDQSASPERQKQHLQDNCYAFQRTIAFHELIPGHHLQACLAKIGISDLRKHFRSTVLIEGWGLYTEVLMAEQGYLNEPATTLINLRNALWRAVRVVVDVGLHVGGMSLEEATKLLQDKVRMEYHMASGEAKRYTTSPTYQSSYLLGKEQIVSLRKEYESKLGDEYTIKKFHDKLTSYGSIPVALVRREMLAGR